MYKTFGLLLILALAFYMAFIPHIGYAYPLHVDEWMHMTYAETIAQTGSITFPDPFTGLTNINIGDNPWLGFHILWAMFQQVSGIDWVVLFRYFPSIIFILTVLAVYILANREGYGLEAAFFSCLIPTTGGLLGPAFMVPMALGLLFIPLSLFLAYNVKNRASYLIIFLFTCFLVMSHATTAVILGILLLPYIFINFRANKAHSLAILASVALPFVLLIPLIFNIISSHTGQLFTQQFMSPYVEVPALLWKYGLLPLTFSFIGTVILIRQGGRKNFGYIAGLALLVAVMLVFIRLHYGFEEIYERGLTSVLLMLSIFAGAGLLFIRELRFPAGFLDSHRSCLFKNAGAIGCGIAAAAMLAVAVPTRANAVFYHIIDDDDYRAFVWIKEHMTTGYGAALVDPWKANAFTPISNKKVLHRIWFNQERVDDIIYQVLQNGQVSSVFLTANRLSFIYGNANYVGTDFVRVRDNVYLTNPNVSSHFMQDTALLKNPDFEQISGYPPTSWQTYSKDCTPTFLYPEPGRGTSWSVGIEIPKTPPPEPTSFAIWLQTVDVKPGASYLIGGWVKTKNIEGQDGAIIMPGWQEPGYKWICDTEFMPYIKGNSDWSYYQGTVTAPPNATMCSVYCFLGNCSGEAWFDDIMFEAK